MVNKSLPENFNIYIIFFCLIIYIIGHTKLYPYFIISKNNFFDNYMKQHLYC
jgi:hypothetical protein